MATATKKKKLTLGRLALVAGTQQTYFETFDICGQNRTACFKKCKE
jgi:hypothetical protein